MYQDEFDALKATHEGLLTQEQWDPIEEAIFFQRDLLPQEVGQCTFEKEEKVLHKASPLFQKYRSLQRLNQLELKVNGKDVPFLSTSSRSFLRFLP